MRALLILAVLLFATSTAFAQKKTDDQKKADAAREAAEDRAYKSSLQRIPPKAGSIDPWGDVKGNAPADPGVPSQTRAKKTQPAAPAQ